MTIYVWPPIQLSTEAAPTRFNLDGVSTPVSEDTADQSNSIGLPVHEVGLTMVDEGDAIVGSTLSAAPLLIREFSVNIRKMRFVNNGGSVLIILLNDVAVGFSAPGEKETFDFKANAGDELKLATVAGAGSGNIYLTYFG